MSIVKREPRATWPSLVEWPEERFDRTFREMFRDFFSGATMFDRLAETIAHPMHLEEYVEGGSCVIRVEMPGIDPAKDVEITVQGGVLVIDAHREERKEEERPEGYRSEFHYGAFRRAIRLPDGVTESDVKATYKDGILEVRMPVEKKQAEATKIAIQRS